MRAAAVVLALAGLVGLVWFVTFRPEPPARRVDVPSTAVDGDVAPEPVAGKSMRGGGVRSASGIADGSVSNRAMPLRLISYAQLAPR